MRAFRTLLAATAFALAILPAGAAFADKLQDVLSAGTLRIGVLADSAPWGFKDGSGELTGFDVELAKLMAADMGVTLEIVEVTGPSRIPSLLSDKIDVLVAAAGATPERAQQVMFSQPYVAVQLGVYGKADTPSFEKPDDLAGHSIAVAKGSTLDVWLTDNAKGAQIVRFEDAPSAIAAFRAGQVEMFAENSAIALNVSGADASVALKFAIRQSPAHAAVAQGEQNLLNWLNTDLFTNRMNGKLQALQMKWFKEAAPLPTL
ncbi:transporter substrate-binding domain-containing protein [Aureimonas sp. AU40]|uniref:transporter substrate-binding domain-containing protein n=1 Tax=Aureimonas sp. AU40 TaxID=1637747 RepID=UPI0007836A2A|nr:transporter substrate-binding domain-containing protein [Aureimonas sp. AU40]